MVYVKNLGMMILVIFVMKSNVKLVGTDRETTIIDAAGFAESSVIFCSDVEDVYIERLTLTGGTGIMCERG